MVWSNWRDKEKISLFCVLLYCWWQIVKLREIDYQTGLGWEGMRDATSLHLPWSQL